MESTTSTPELLRDLASIAREKLWLEGDLQFKLDANQLEMCAAIKSADGKRFVLECARRLGKTYLLCVLAIEACLKQPRARVVYGGQTTKDIEEFVIPTIEDIILDAPDGVGPVFNAQSGHWTFPNGSHIHLFGCDDKLKARRGRGAGAHLVIVDEAGFVPILGFVLNNVLKPQTMTTGGRILLASTPSDEPDHDFTKQAEIAEANGAYCRRTIYDNPRLSREVIERYIEDDARDQGMTVDEYKLSDTFRREYLAERVTDKHLTVVPEWAEMRASLMVETVRPEFFDAMTLLDMGGADPHAVLFCYWHFLLGKFIVEDELLLRGGENTEELSAAIKAKEKELWGTDLFDGALRAVAENDLALLANLPDWMAEKARGRYAHQPYARWADNDLQMIRDLHELNGIAFIPTAKDDKKWQVNNLRVMLKSGEVLVNPRCTNLDRHLRQTVWKNERRKDYKRKNGEHGDLVDALVYGCRNINKQKNPFPARWTVGQETFVSSRRPVESSGTKVMKAFLGDTPLARKLMRGRNGGKRILRGA